MWNEKQRQADEERIKNKNKRTDKKMKGNIKQKKKAK